MLILQEESEKRAIEEKISNIQLEEERVLKRIQNNHGDEILNTQPSQTYSSPKKNASGKKLHNNGSSSEKK